MANEYSYQVLNPMTTYLSLVKRQFIKKGDMFVNMFDSVVEIFSVSSSYET